MSVGVSAGDRLASVLVVPYRQERHALPSESVTNTWTMPAVRAALVPSAFRHAAPKVRFGSCHPELTSRAVALTSLPDL